MPRLIVPALLLAAAASGSIAAEPPEPSFSAAALRAHVEFLADGLLEGRKAGTRGYDLAARYVATQFAAVGLVAPEAGWSQAVPMLTTKTSTKEASAFFVGDQPFAHRGDAVVSASPTAPSVDLVLDAVFAGYCIDSPELGIDDFAGLDVKGKAVACLGGFPKGMRSDIGAFLGSRRSLMAQARGAIATVNLRTLQSDKVFPWERALEYADDGSTTWIQKDGTPYRLAPLIRATVFLHRPAADALFEGAPRTFADVLAEADREGGRPRGFALAQKVRFVAASEQTRFSSTNVLGLLPGSDPVFAREVVVLVAHLDHLGTKNGEVYHGALDNAAGVATLIEVARVLAASPRRPKRSVLFAAVTGEEMGLLGSQYLARYPAFKDAKHVAVVCLDSPILTYDFTDVIAFGEEHSTMGPAIANAVRRAGVVSTPDPVPEQGLFTRSDHYSFVKEGVPGVFLVTGFANGGKKAFDEYERTAYHRPADDMRQPIDWNAAAKFARINYLIARDVADAAQRPLWYEGGLIGNTYAPKEPKARR
jgi:hypothetical protein